MFVGGWLLTSALAVIGLLTLGHGLLLDMTQGSDHRTGLDLIGGGALIALGGRELIRGVLDNGAAPAWSGAVDRFAAMPLPLLLLISSVTEVISPDDLLLFAKSAAVILAAQLPLQEEIACSIGFSFAATALLLVPFLAVLIELAKEFFRCCNAAKPPFYAGENWWWAASVSGWGPIWAGRGSAA